MVRKASGDFWENLRNSSKEVSRWKGRDRKEGIERKVNHRKTLDGISGDFLEVCRSFKKT